MKSVIEKYLNRHWRNDYEIKASAIPSDLIVVIPVYLEEAYLPVLMKSLEKTAAISGTVELVLVFNYSDADTASNKQKQHDLSEHYSEWITGRSSERMTYTLINAFDLPKKYSGAGWARKIGMDYAVSKFHRYGNDKGIIVSLDADCEVQENYFIAIRDFFRQTSMAGGTIYFEHPTLSAAGENEQDDAIIQYELHLRYYLQVLRWTGFPFAFHTVGSCFAVTAERYVRAGGMPRKQAGEDFYFLQKAIPMGHFGEINSTCVYPSARVSDRVPFGTGPTIQKLLDQQTEYATYNLEAFIDLKAVFNQMERFYGLDKEGFLELVQDFSGRMRSYLVNSDFFDALEQVNRNCSNEASFKKRFWEVFSAFRVVKYLNYVHVHFLEKMAVFDAAIELLELLEPDGDHAFFESGELLRHYRQLEKEDVRKQR